MLTAGRLAGAMIFGVFGWYMAIIAIPFFPEANAPDFWIEASAFGSLLLGWRVCGSRVGRGYWAAIGIGLTTSFAMGLIALGALGFNQMIYNSLRLRYDGVMEGIVDVFRQMIEFSAYFYDVPLIATLFIGGVLCAWLTEFFAQRYP